MKVKYSIVITCVNRRPKYKLSLITDAEYVPQLGMRLNVLKDVQSSSIESVFIDIYKNYYEALLSLMITKDKDSLLKLKSDLIELGWNLDQLYS